MVDKIRRGTGPQDRSHDVPNAESSSKARKCSAPTRPHPLPGDGPAGRSMTHLGAPGRTRSAAPTGVIVPRLASLGQMTTFVQT